MPLPDSFYKRWMGSFEGFCESSYLPENAVFHPVNADGNRMMDMTDPANPVPINGMFEVAGEQIIAMINPNEDAVTIEWRDTDPNVASDAARIWFTAVLLPQSLTPIFASAVRYPSALTTLPTSRLCFLMMKAR